MTDAELQEIRAKCERVFPLVHEYGVSQEFIAVAIETIPKLLAEIDRLRVENQCLRDYASGRYWNEDGSLISINHPRNSTSQDRT
jgi:hypothetical protein